MQQSARAKEGNQGRYSNNQNGSFSTVPALFLPGWQSLWSQRPSTKHKHQPNPKKIVPKWREMILPRGFL